MATITNNNYAGSLTPGLSTLMTIGSNDISMFHVGLTNSTKHRFGYVTASAPLQLMSGPGGTGLCGLVSNGVGTLDYMNLDLKGLGVRLAECRDAFSETDWGGAFNGVLAQEIDVDILNAYTSDLVKQFSKGMQDLRWSGDTGSGVAALAYQDGIVKQIQDVGAFVPTTNEVGYQQIATTAVTATNVIDEIKKVINALPNEVTSYGGFKVVVGPVVSSALRSAVMVSTGVNNLPMINPDLTTGLLTDNFFGYSIYEARGLGATAANSNIILAGIFEDSNRGILKVAMNKADDEKSIQIRDLENDSIQFSLASRQAVGLIPDLSQVAMNA